MKFQEVMARWREVAWPIRKDWLKDGRCVKMPASAEKRQEGVGKGANMRSEDSEQIL